MKFWWANEFLVDQCLVDFLGAALAAIDLMLLYQSRMPPILGSPNREDLLQCRCCSSSQSCLNYSHYFHPPPTFPASWETWSPKMLSFPQWATPRTACHKLQDELIVYYLFIDTVRRLTQPQTDTLAKRRCTGMFAGQACNRQAGRHLSNGNRTAGCRWQTAILTCFCVTSCSAAAYLGAVCCLSHLGCIFVG